MSNTITKNQTAEVKTKSGSNYSYKYVDIAQIHDYLESINARYIQCIDRVDNDDYIMTKRCFDNEWEKEWLRGARVVNATLIGNNNPAQQQGSALTYARRYSLLMAFGLATEDDDAQSLTEQKEVTEEDAQNYEFTFGKNKGRKLVDVIEESGDYIDWLVQNSKDEYLLKCIELLTGEVKPNENEVHDSLVLMVQLKKLAQATNTDIEKIKEHYKVELIDDLSNEQMVEAINTMKRKVK